MEPTTPSRAEPRPGADWRRAAEGIQLAGIAVFLLLNTTGVLPWSFWLDALTLWPVLIMSAGLRIAVERTSAPWLVLLGPALVLGSLAWVASGARLDGQAVGPWTEETRPLPQGATAVRLRAELAGARLRIAAGGLQPGLLVDARSAGARGAAGLDSGVEDGVAEVRLKSWGRGRVVVVPGPRQRWDLHVPSELPVGLHLTGAAIGGSVDLGAGRPAESRVEGVFIGLDLDLPSTERPVQLRLAGVFNTLHVRVPAGTPVRVHGPGLPFNAIERGVPGVPGRAGYDVRVDGIFTAVAVDTRRADVPAATPEPRPARPEAERPPAEAVPSPGRS